MVKSFERGMILDSQKTHDGWVARVKFLWEWTEERAQSITALSKKNINAIYVELGHPSKSITHAITKAMGIQVTSTFKLC